MFFLAIQPHANKSYYEFKHSYKPHGKLLEPKNPIVLACANEGADFIASVFSETLKKKDYSNFQLLICSINRSKIDSVLRGMNHKLVLEGLNILEQEWLQEILYCLREDTYNDIMFQVK